MTRSRMFGDPVIVAFNVERATKDRLQKVAYENHMTLSEFIRTIIEDWLATHRYLDQ